MRSGRRQRVTAAWTVRRQPYPAVGTELPVRFDLAAAIETLVEELVKFFMELEEGRRHPALLGLLFLVVHGSPFIMLSCIEHPAYLMPCMLLVAQESCHLRTTKKPNQVRCASRALGKSLWSRAGYPELPLHACRRAHATGMGRSLTRVDGPHCRLHEVLVRLRATSKGA
jgi:hypothetical protein